MTLMQELAAITSVVDGTAAAYLNDSTEVRGLHGRADAVVVPGSTTSRSSPAAAGRGMPAARSLTAGSCSPSSG